MFETGTMDVDTRDMAKAGHTTENEPDVVNIVMEKIIIGFRDEMKAHRIQNEAKASCSKDVAEDISVFHVVEDDVLNFEGFEEEIETFSNEVAMEVDPPDYDQNELKPMNSKVQQKISSEVILSVTDTNTTVTSVKESFCTENQDDLDNSKIETQNKSLQNNISNGIDMTDEQSRCEVGLIKNLTPNTQDKQSQGEVRIRNDTSKETQNQQKVEENVIIKEILDTIVKDISMGGNFIKSQISDMISGIEISASSGIKTNANSDIEMDMSHVIETNASCGIETNASSGIETNVNSDIETDMSHVIETTASCDIESEVLRSVGMDVSSVRKEAMKRSVEKQISIVEINTDNHVDNEVKLILDDVLLKVETSFLDMERMTELSPTTCDEANNICNNVEQKNVASNVGITKHSNIESEVTVDLSIVKTEVVSADVYMVPNFSVDDNITVNGNSTLFTSRPQGNVCSTKSIMRNCFVRLLKMDIKTEEEYGFPMTSTGEPGAQERYECKICLKEFSCGAVLDKHCSIKHPTSSSSWFCELCQRGFSSWQNLEAHKELHNPKYKFKAASDDGKAALFVCDSCCRSFPSKRSLVIHSRSHSVLCSVCSQPFTSIAKLTVHMKTHPSSIQKATPVKTEPFSSPTTRSSPSKMHFSFNENASLRASPTPSVDTCLSPTTSRTKNRDSWFECMVCHVRCKTRTKLADHRRKHYTDKGFYCLSCKKTFSSKNGLVTHIANHTPRSSGFLKVESETRPPGVKSWSDVKIEPDVEDLVQDEVKVSLAGGKAVARGGKFNCRICRKTFLTKNSLNSHRGHHVKWKMIGKRHGRGESNECRLCYMRFSNPNSLAHHSRRHYTPMGFYCTQCKKTYSSSRGFAVHMVAHTRDKTAGKMQPLDAEQTEAFSSVSSWPGVKIEVVPENDPLELPEVYRPGSFKCDVCFKTFTTKNSLNSHKGHHTNPIARKSMKKRFECPICRKTFPSIFSQRGHMAVHRSQLKATQQPKQKPQASNHKSTPKSHVLPDYHKKFTCQMCSKTFNAMKNLSCHISSKHGALSGRFKCEVCNFRFRLQDGLTRHLIAFPAHDVAAAPASPDQKQQISVECPECGQLVPDTNVLRQHLLFVHSVALNLDCKFCPERFTRKKYLKRHMLERHPQDTYQCELCPKVLMTRKAYRIHLKKVHRAVGRLNVDRIRNSLGKMCDIINLESCNETQPNVMISSPNVVVSTPSVTVAVPKGAVTSSSTKRAASSKKSKLVHCALCPRTFRQETSLKRHMLYHEDGRTYSCQQCRRMFYNHEDLVVHERAHAGTSGRACPVCSKSFNSSYFLKKHMNSHRLLEQVKTLKCPCCVRSFSEENYLNAHMRAAHMDLEPCVCPICNQAFTTLAKFTGHVKNVHQGIMT